MIIYDSIETKEMNIELIEPMECHTDDPMTLEFELKAQHEMEFGVHEKTFGKFHLNNEMYTTFINKSIFITT